jgi:multidrug transporter EmrE-like cation transporter
MSWLYLGIAITAEVAASAYWKPENGWGRWLLPSAPPDSLFYGYCHK